MTVNRIETEKRWDKLNYKIRRLKEFDTNQPSVTYTAEEAIRKGINQAMRFLNASHGEMRYKSFEKAANLLDLGEAAARKVEKHIESSIQLGAGW